MILFNLNFIKIERWEKEFQPKALPRKKFKDQDSLRIKLKN